MVFYEFECESRECAHNKMENFDEFDFGLGLLFDESSDEEESDEESSEDDSDGETEMYNSVERIKNWINSNEGYVHDWCNIRQKRTRNRVPKVDLWQTVWGRLLKDPTVCQAESLAGQKFRRRFRVPYPLFTELLVPICKTAKVFNQERESYILTEFKVLLALRILGRGACADDIQELIEIGESTVLNIFHQFCERFCKNFYELYVKFPVGDKLKETMAVYERLGIPGAMGSIDATHVKWDKCPDTWRPFCKGKEGFPSLAFMVCVDHSRTIQHCSRYFFGACNDKQILANDTLSKSLAQGSARNIEFSIFDGDGKVLKCKGAFLISDGGMLKVSFMSAFVL